MGCASSNWEVQLKPGNIGSTLEEDAAITAGIAADPDNPERTDADFKRAKPLAELADGIRRSRGRPPAEKTKRQISLRIDSDVIERFKAAGPGWQSRVNAALRKVVGI